MTVRNIPGYARFVFSARKPDDYEMCARTFADQITK